jgi:PIN domain nuclease of toxin-antitoxin system
MKAKYLLDTHTILWGAEDSDKLVKSARDIINDKDTQIFVSVASLWEFAIKYSIGKIDFDGGLAYLREIIKQADFTMLPISESYLENVITLPFIHRDPFDRLLIATAKTEGMTILTADENIQKYDVPWLW